MTSNEPEGPLDHITEEQKSTIKKPEWLQEDFRELTIEETKDAATDLVVKYPKIARGMVLDPIPSQSIGLISYQFFPENAVMKNGLHGFMRLDTITATESQATKRSNEVIRFQDSYHKIHQIYRGHWVPISDDSTWAKEQMDADIGVDGRKLRDEASLHRQKEDSRKIREIEERRRVIEKENETDEASGGVENTIDFFVTVCNKIRLNRSHIRDQLANIEQMKEKLEESEKWYEESLKKHNEWATPITIEDNDGSDVEVPKWIDHFNSMRAKVGLTTVFTEENFWDINKIKM